MNAKLIFAGLSLLFAACSNESEQPIVVENPVEDSPLWWLCFLLVY